MRAFIILPAFNEADNLPAVFAALSRLQQETYNLEVQVLLVDDCSSDGTAEVARQAANSLSVDVLSNRAHQGLAGTLLRGIVAAAERAGEHDLVVCMDADNSHLPGQIMHMMRAIQEGRDVVIASRFRSGAVVRGVPVHRKLLSLGASLAGRMLCPIPGVRDYSCGYRAYEAGFLKRALSVYGVDLCPERGFACMMALLIKLHRLGAIVGEVPIILRYDQKKGHSKMRILTTIISTVRLLIAESVWWGRARR